MSRFLLQKRQLINDVFEKALNSSAESSFSGILKFLEHTLLDDYNIQISYKSLETYHKVLVGKNADYNIKPVILNNLSEYLGYIDFKDYCESSFNLKQNSQVKVSINGLTETSKNAFSDIIINITNSPVFTMPEFVSKYKNGFGAVGILLISGLILNKVDLFSSNEKIKVPVENVVLSTIKDSVHKVNSFSPQTFVHNQVVNSEKQAQSISEIAIPIKKKMECMYWNGDQYISVFCDEQVENAQIEQRNFEKQKLKKILRPDTLTVDNAMGKVWYNKYNNKVEFFTYHGIHPGNGKTLKEVTEYILEKY